MNKYITHRDSLNTGDILFFSGNGPISNIIKLMSNSPWSHVGLLVKSDDLDILLVWEATTLSNVPDLSEGRIISGVQTVDASSRINMFDGSVSVRRFGGFVDSTMIGKLKDFRLELKGKPYESSRWELIKSLVDFGFSKENTEDFSSIFCSEMLAEAFERMGILDGKMPANEYVPRDFSSGNMFDRHLMPGMTYGPEIELK